MTYIPTACYCYSKIGFSGKQFDGHWHWNNLLQMRYVDLCVMLEEMMLDIAQAQVL